jgi:DNA-binding IscR family transcriptional regulator
MNSEFTIAVHSLVLLAYTPDHMATSEMIAQNVCTHPARVRKVMGLLRRADFVDTKEGIGGGYFLNCDPHEVSLADIWRAVAAGTLKPHWCSGDPEMDCVVASNIQPVMDCVFGLAERHLESFWEQWTISGVLEELREAQRCKNC